eukprot:13176765-Alexandrium_andersonii.AAC.1
MPGDAASNYSQHSGNPGTRILQLSPLQRCATSVFWRERNSMVAIRGPPSRNDPRRRRNATSTRH